jgi:hypothetical protein
MGILSNVAASRLRVNIAPLSLGNLHNHWCLVHFVQYKTINICFLENFITEKTLLCRDDEKNQNDKQKWTINITCVQKNQQRK